MADGNEKFLQTSAFSKGKHSMAVEQEEAMSKVYCTQRKARDTKFTGTQRLKANTDSSIQRKPLG